MLSVPGVPVTVENIGASPITKISVHILTAAEQTKAGAEGLGLTVSRADGVAAAGRLRVTLTYAGFRGLFGGEWVQRLGVRQVPDCMMAAVVAADCQIGASVTVANDQNKGVVTAEFDVPGVGASAAAGAGNAAAAVDGAASGGAVTLALSSGTAGGGNYAATSLSSSAKWDVGIGSGNFSWSYPIPVAPAQAGSTPSLSLAY